MGFGFGALGLPWFRVATYYEGQDWMKAPVFILLRFRKGVSVEVARQAAEEVMMLVVAVVVLQQ